MATPVKAFISYAREDENYKNELKKWLKPYADNQLVQIWDDSSILPSEEWNKSIIQALQDTEVLLFLISRDFMASDYIRTTEIEKALERYRQGTVKIVPIIIRPADFSYLHLKKFQALPRNAKPISSFEDKDTAWLEVAQGLRQLFESLQAKQGTDSQTNPTSNGDSKPDKNTIKNMLAQSKVAEALKILNNHSGLDGDLQMQITLLSSRFNANKKNKMIGIISSEDANREDNKIVYALLSILDEI